MPTINCWRAVMLVALATFTMLLAVSPFDASAQSTGARFKPLERTPIRSSFLPKSLSQESVKVTLILDGESVAEARAHTPDHLISEQSHQAIHARLDQQHAAIETAVIARGGKVLAHFQDALNGIKVQIARSDLASLSEIPGVLKVVAVPRHTLNNEVSVPFIGAPQVWQATPGFRGEHIRIAILDTGIDYTHANFGGPGTVAAFQAAAATSTQKPDPTLVGPNAPKVKGGIDLAGDAYDANTPGSLPMPDPNPLDCAGHGSHVAGTAAGFGVANDGSTYHGPYNQAAYAGGFRIGPGVAPLADLYAVRIFGCSGSTDLVTDGIDWAVHHHMGVISMSLGSDYGTNDSSDAIASNHAVQAGIIVVAAAGNAGPSPYITGSPATGTEVISAAAMDARRYLLDGVALSLASGLTVDGIDTNELPLPQGKLPVLILKSGNQLGFGCDPKDYPSGAKGAVVIVSRGTCTFQIKADNAMAAGAVALGVVNNVAGSFYPLIQNVTIPFISMFLSDAPALAAQPRSTHGMLAMANVPDAGYRLAASFSSGGPRMGDGSLKPDIAAPGVNVVSTAMGSGNLGVAFSGTSMATPHVAGVAALAIQAHPNWRTAAQRASIVETASPAATTDYSPRIEGAGVVQAPGATLTEVSVLGTEHADLGLLSFGVAELTADYHDSREVVVTNHAHTSQSFTVTATAVGGVPHSVRLSSSSIALQGQSQTPLRMSLSVPGASVGATHDASGNDRMAEVAGYLTLAPEGSSNHGVSLTLPYYFVPRARSNVSAALSGGKNPSIQLTNRNGLIAGNGDFYAWGLKQNKPSGIDPAFAPRAVGVQANPISATDSVLVFAVNSFGRFSNPALGEYDMYIDVNGDGVFDYVLFSADIGLVTTGQYANGQIGTFLFNIKTGALLPEFPADAPTDGSTVLMPVYASDLGITPTNPRFAYALNAFDGNGGSNSVPGVGTFNAFGSAVSTAMFVPVAPNSAVTVPVAVDATELARTPALGFMVVTEDNLSGASQAHLVPLTH